MRKAYTGSTNPNDFEEQHVVTDRNLFTANGTAALAFTNHVLKLITFNSQEEIDKATDLYQIVFLQRLPKIWKSIRISKRGHPAKTS